MLTRSSPHLGHILLVLWGHLGGHLVLQVKTQLFRAQLLQRHNTILLDTKGIKVYFILLPL